MSNYSGLFFVYRGETFSFDAWSKQNDMIIYNTERRNRFLKNKISAFIGDADTSLVKLCWAKGGSCCDPLNCLLFTQPDCPWLK